MWVAVRPLAELSDLRRPSLKLWLSKTLENVTEGFGGRNDVDLILLLVLPF